LRLPESLRPELQKVHGELVSEALLPERVKGHFVITVGDVVTYTLLRMGIKPDVAVVDYRTKRSDVVFEDIRNFGDIVYQVENPPGTITPELWRAVREAIASGRKVRIDVLGEEDLAVIPAVLHSPQGAIVIYGMPNTGVAIITVNDEHKMNALRIIEQMEV
jgi:uncharacterized protein (UPF0218 family)